MLLFIVRRCLSVVQKKTCMVRSDDIGGVQTGKVLTLKYVIVSRVFFIRFFFSTVKTGGGQQVLSSSVSYFYLQGSKHLHSL